MQREMQKKVRKHFKPELLNRIDNIVIFRPLDEKQIGNVVEMEVAKLQKRLVPKGITLTLDEASKDYIRKGYDAVMGARSLRRAIVDRLEDPLAEKMLLATNDVKSIIVTFTDGELNFELRAEASSDQSEEALVK